MTTPKQKTGLGFFWLLPGFLATTAATVATAGTIAAVAGSIADLLAKIDPNSDFAKAMRDFRDVANIVKIPAIVAAGYGGLISGGIPAATQDASARWYELLRSPVEAAGGPTAAAKLPEVARTLAWGQKALASYLPPGIATTATPQLLEAFAKGKKDEIENAIKSVKDLQKKYLEDRWKDLWNSNKAALPTSLRNELEYYGGNFDKLAEGKVKSAVQAMVATPPPAPPPFDPGIHAPRNVPSSTSAAATASTSTTGNVLLAAGLLGLTGAAALKLAPPKWKLPRVSKKQLWIGAGVSGAVALLGLFLRSGSKQPSVQHGGTLGPGGSPAASMAPYVSR